jgi:hypothetical protein
MDYVELLNFKRWRYKFAFKLKQYLCFENKGVQQIVAA